MFDPLLAARFLIPASESLVCWRCERWSNRTACGGGGSAQLSGLIHARSKGYITCQTRGPDEHLGRLEPIEHGRVNGTKRREAPAVDDRLAARTADQIASLKPFATRNATFFDALLALIRISSPVAGLRPLRAGRAGRIRTCRTPRLGMRILLPFFSTRPMSATKPVNISIACFLGTS